MASRHLVYFGLAFLGLSQFGDLQSGQTRGLSVESRGNHSWPQRQRQPKSITIPMGLSACFIASPFTIYQEYILILLTRQSLLVYTTGRSRPGGNGEGVRLDILRFVPVIVLRAFSSLATQHSSLCLDGQHPSGLLWQTGPPQHRRPARRRRVPSLAASNPCCPHLST
jgi:hypothetical protein